MKSSRGWQSFAGGWRLGLGHRSSARGRAGGLWEGGLWLCSRLWLGSGVVDIWIGGGREGGRVGWFCGWEMDFRFDNACMYGGRHGGEDYLKSFCNLKHK